MLKALQYDLSVRHFRASAAAVLVVTLWAFSTSLISPSVAQQSGEVPADIRDAIGDALRDEPSTTSSEPAPLRLDVSDNLTPTSTEPPERMSPPMLNGPEIMTGPDEDIAPEAEVLSPPAEKEDSSWSSSMMVAPSQSTTQRALPAVPPGSLGDFHRYVEGCAPDDTIAPMASREIQGFGVLGTTRDVRPPGRCDWRGAGGIPWQAFAQWDYVRSARTAHVSEYRPRVDDTIEFVFRITGQTTLEHYRVQAGDTLRVEVAGFPEHGRDEVTVQPDGYISLSGGEVQAAGRTLAEIAADLNQLLAKNIDNPRATVSAVSVNTVTQELLNTMDHRDGKGGQSRRAQVTPTGTVQLPAIGPIPAQGLSLSELKREVEAAYASIVTGLEVTPILEQRAQSSIYVLGEVKIPGRYELHGPTTTMQGVALAGGWIPEANLRQVIVLRRDDHWNLMAAQLDLHEALNAREPCPVGEFRLRDSDIVLVPKRTIRVVAEAVELLSVPGAGGLPPMLDPKSLTTL